MNPLTPLFRRSREFRVLFYLSMVPLGALLSLVAARSLSAYAEVGADVLVGGMMFFALWAWWYGEDRDRRRAASAAHGNGASSSNGDAQPVNGDAHSGGAA